MSARRVVVFGTFDLGAGYPRARSHLAALEAAGVEVVQCREGVLPERGARTAALRDPRLWPAALLRLAGARRRLRCRLRSLLREHAPDVVFVAYPGHLAASWARSVFAGPIVLDLFLSAHDTVALDRGLLRSDGAAARALLRMDRRACLAADRVLLDTPDHAGFVSALTGVERSRFGWVPVSDPDAPLAPAPYPDPAGRLEVLFVGTGVPLHGVPVILDALARAPGTRLTFVGGSARERQAAAAFPGTRLRLLPWTDIGDVHALLAASHVALGIFGTGDKAGRVIPFKVVHALAAGRCVVTADTSAARALLRPGVDCRVVPAGDALELARILRALARAQDQLPGIGVEARSSYERTFSVEAAGTRLLAELAAATGVAWRAPPLLPSTAS